MIRKTYGVPGKIETVMILKVGKSQVIINFTGGSIVDFARKPANYTTSDPIHQAMIENSAQYKRGEIKLMSAIDVPDDAATVARKERAALRHMMAEEKRQAEEAAAKAPAVEEPHDEEDGGDPKPVTPATTEEPKDPGEDEVKDGGEEPTEEDPTKEPDEDPADDGSIHVADKRDAIEWLKENFPEKEYTATKLRTKEAFDAACAECGVTFVFTA